MLATAEHKVEFVFIGRVYFNTYQVVVVVVYATRWEEYISNARAFRLINLVLLVHKFLWVLRNAWLVLHWAHEWFRFRISGNCFNDWF